MHFHDGQTKIDVGRELVHKFSSDFIVVLGVAGQIPLHNGCFTFYGTAAYLDHRTIVWITFARIYSLVIAIGAHSHFYIVIQVGYLKIWSNKL